MARVLSFFLVLVTSFSAFAGQVDHTFAMAGLAETGDTVTLRFNPAPSTEGLMTILGNRTGTNPKSVDFTYRLIPKTVARVGDPRVQITFPDKQSLTIFCDPLSNNCRSEGFVTEGGVTFALPWHIEHR